MPSAPAWPSCFHDRSLRSLYTSLGAGACRNVLSTELAHTCRRSAFVHKRALHDVPVLGRPVAGLGSETVSEESVSWKVSASSGVRKFVRAKIRTMGPGEVTEGGNAASSVVLRIHERVFV